jgi:hypothetical protein
MKRHIYSFVVLGIALNLAGCHCAMCPMHKSQTVSHVVLFWMKDPQDAAARKRLVDATETLRQIPGVLHLTYGKAVPSTRPIVDSTFDLGIVITFPDQASLNAYATHPIHVKAAQEVLLPLTKKVQVYDIARD